MGCALAGRAAAAAAELEDAAHAGESAACGRWRAEAVAESAAGQLPEQPVWEDRGGEYASCYRGRWRRGLGAGSLEAAALGRLTHDEPFLAA